ncbi:MAG: FeoB-associated Cys-rich membrane protein [Clostridia bacterium]|nr:FeoB-associated Cys-rich membrane protein [Clostridia bacterium]
MTDIIIIAVVVIIIGAASLYIYKAKKSGQKCVGCPSSKTCGSKNCSCGCSSNESAKSDK